jgi:hypothetical protein
VYPGKSMSCLRSIILLFTLLAQIWPAQAVMSEGGRPETCEMGCCAAMAEPGMSACGCLEEPSTPPVNPAAPASADERPNSPRMLWAAQEPLSP